MSTQYGALGEQYKRLDDLDGYSIESGDTDPRGWTVVDDSGQQIGEVDDLIVDTTRMKVRYLALDGADERTSARLLDVNTVDLDTGSRRVIARGASGSGVESGYSEQAGITGRAPVASEDRTLARSEEELRIGKREVERGEVRVGKRVETEHVREPVTRRREEVVIERRPVASSEARGMEIGEEEVRVPLTEEEVVVDKRPVVKEELVIGKRTVEERDVVEADVRRERFEVEGEGVQGHVDEDLRSRRRDRKEGR